MWTTIIHENVSKKINDYKIISDYITILQKILKDTREDILRRGTNWIPGVNASTKSGKTLV